MWNEFVGWMAGSKYYYRTIFPAEAVWTLFAQRADAANREFACEVEIGEGAVVWKRYESCKSPEELRRVVTGSAFKALHIGPSFSEAAHRARVPGVVPMGKELVFDLDLQDVAWFGVDKDDQQANDRFVRATFASCHVLIEILKEIMDFEHFLPVYSGRRGVHLWVLDERAFGWADEVRAALCAFVAAEPSKDDPKVISTHHMRKNPSFGSMTQEALCRAEDVLIAPFQEGGVGLLDRKRDVTAFLDKVFDPEVDEKFEHARTETRALAMLASSGKTGWDAFGSIENALKNNKFWHNRLRDVVFSLTWPALDVGASAKQNHCTKSMFSLHAKTGRVAVPVPVHSLLSSAEETMPPIVTLDELKDDAHSHSRALFDRGLSALEVATRAMGNTHIRSMDIEDLCGSKRSREL